MQRLSNLFRRPTLADHIRQAPLPAQVVELDCDLIRDTEDFDNATCAYGPDGAGVVHVAKHSRKWSLSGHVCECSVDRFTVGICRIPRNLQDLQDVSGTDFGQADFLSRWMSSMPAIGNLVLMDLCLPGTHDSLSYDLSDHVAEGDSIPSLPTIHGFLEMNPTAKHLVMNEVMKLCKCQTISIQEQLDAGIRFLDFRVIWSPRRDCWVGVHGLETKQPALHYLKEIRAWLMAHPGEILIIWLSRHGAEEHTGTQQYPHVDAENKQNFYQSILDIFGELVVNHEETPLKETQIQKLVALKRQLVLVCSDWSEFTGRSSLALDAAEWLQNDLPGSHDDPVLDALKFFSQSHETFDKYHIVSLACSVTYRSKTEALNIQSFIRVYSSTLQYSVLCTLLFCLKSNWEP